MNRMDYEKAITQANDKGELIGVIIFFSQNITLPWAMFRKYYNQSAFAIGVIIFFSQNIPFRGQRSASIKIKRICEC